MKFRLLDWLVCPLCGGDLTLRDARTHPPTPAREVARATRCVRCHAAPTEPRADGHSEPCASCYGVEVDAGVLECAGGHAFAVRDGLPRLRLDGELRSAPTAAAEDAQAIGASFGREWGHFEYGDRTWANSVDDRCQLFLKETVLTPQQLEGKVVLDAGCGNGSLSQGLTRFGCQVIAADASYSVAAAYRYFSSRGNDRTHFLQADLMNPPFGAESVDVIYSSGVLHHSADTRKALHAIAKALKPGGSVYIWVYGKEPGIVHKLKELFRRMISPLPAPVKHAIVCAWLPQAMLRQYLRTATGRNDASDRLKWRERLVMLLDHYTPRYRWEHTPEELHGWYREMGYEEIATTEVREWGFGVAARKPALNRRSS